MAADYYFDSPCLEKKFYYPDVQKVSLATDLKTLCAGTYYWILRAQILYGSLKKSTRANKV